MYITNRLLIFFFFYSTLSYSFNDKNSRPPGMTDPVAEYVATSTHGIIGSSTEKIIDNPYDNIFQIDIAHLPTEDKKVWLTYELYGVQDHTGIARSINDELAIGGYIGKYSKEWNLQYERISISWLKQGSNVIRFSLPENANHSYKVRNLKIIVGETASEGKEKNNSRNIIINQPDRQYYGIGKGYINGYISGINGDKARLYIDGKEVNVESRAFEHFVKSPSNSMGPWSTLAVVQFPDGHTIQRVINFESATEPDFQIQENSVQSNRLSRWVGHEGATLRHLHAELFFPPAAMVKEELISVYALRHIDIVALNAGMINITREHAAYRFLPHGSTFTEEVEVSIGYDQDKIPQGYTAQDIKTYYFDEEIKQWVELERISVDEERQVIVSKTNHFTDMINGIIKVPETPQTNGFTPTTIKDIKAADPSAEIITIEPPKANSNGSANISYPIKLPPGRLGIQPMVELSYNSEGSNKSWLGNGWNYTVPSITIDTRWGVPRYDPDLESETYVANGMQLHPVAHRSSFVARTAEKQFHPRVEGTFRRIIRHGDHPNNYWWEITDKNGTRNFYGGTPAGGVENNSVLRDASGNIAEWALVETRDLNENFVRFHCLVIEDAGVPGSTVPGHNLFVDRITYTGHGNTEGKYEVLFIRDRELGEPLRPDISIDGSLGFKRVMADLLRKIEILFNGQPIRSYEMKFREGAFRKTLLESIVEFDAVGQQFTEHTLEYYDDVRPNGEFQPLMTSQPWTPQADNIQGDFINPIGLFNDKASAISGNKSSGGGAALAVTAGFFDGQLWSKRNTAGGSFGASQSKNEGLLALVDINGDGLVDKVMKNNSGLFFRPNESGPNGTSTFGDAVPIIGINNFSKGESSTSEYGIESHFGIFAGLQYTTSRSTTNIYFTDANGDQLIDIVNNGVVFFNHLVNGVPTFSLTSANTESPIDAGSSIDPSVVEIDPAEIEEAIDQNPLHDVVRVWEAPFDGTVSIDAPVSLLENTTPDGLAYVLDDGVRVAIQKSNTELWSTLIAAEDFSVKTPLGVNAVTVLQGEKIYFRVQSVEDGAYDQVSWNPVISYTLHSPDVVDANDLPIYQFDAQEDFLISGAMSTGMAIGGEIHIEGDFTKPVTSDDVIVEILLESGGGLSTIFAETLLWNQAITVPIALDQTVLQGDNIYFRVSSQSNVDWTSLSWDPYLYYTLSNDPGITQINDSNGNPIFDFYPTVDFRSYNDTKEPTYSWAAATTGNVDFTPLLTFNPNTESGDITFTIKKQLELVAKQTISVTDGVASIASPINLNVSVGDVLYFDFSVANPLLAEVILSDSVEVNSSSPETVPAGLHAMLMEGLLFGPQYRHWGQFVYNGNRDRAAMPIDESALVLDPALTNPSNIDLSGATTPEEMEDLFDMSGGNDPTDDILVIMFPDNELDIWRGYDDQTYISRQLMSASRMGLDNISPINPIVGDGSANGMGATAINKVHETDNITFSVGIGPAGLNTSSGTTTQLYEYLDMNGDRYPDIVSKNKIQYTLPFGGLEPSATTHNFGEVMESSHAVNIGFTLGGVFFKSSPESTKDYPKGNKASDSEDRALVSAGISGNFATNEDEVDFGLMDINGDGLPDRVYSNGTVQLNIGYDFLPPEQWSYSDINDGESINYGAGLNINIDNYSISVGVGLSRSESEVNNTLEDLNGDGLLDYVVSASPLVVSINTGNGFAAPIFWNGADAVSENISTGESVNGAFTVCIPIPPIFPVAKICFNPSANASRGANRTTVRFQDVNGDGFPDFLQSDVDSELTVSLSTIDRTNKLKSVQKPLGSVFTVDYTRIGNLYEMPNNVWAMSSIEVTDGVLGDGADRMLTTFKYEDGFFDRHERDFYGFNKVQTIHHDTEDSDAPYRYVTDEYINDNFYQRGLLKSNNLSDAGFNKFTESIHDYVLKDLLGNTLSDAFKDIDDGVAFPALIETEELYYEGQSTVGKSTSMTFEYDLLGNITSYTDLGEPTPDDDYTTQIEYHILPSLYVVGEPKSMHVTAGGETFRRSETSIDPANGDIIEIRKYLESGEISRFNMEFDTYGNIETAIRPENELGQRLSYTYTYDPEVFTYVERVEDSYGYVSTSTYDLRFGRMLSNTDMNGQRMEYALDPIGRLSSITGPKELAAGVPFTIAFQYNPDADVPWALTQHYDPDNPGNLIETATFIDGLRRPLQVKKDGAIFTGKQIPDNEEMIVSGRIIFDAFGRLKESYHPLTEPKGTEGIFNSSFDNITPTTTTYDVLDRQLVITQPDQSTLSRTYDFGTDREGNVQFRSRLTDANGIWKEYFENVRGLRTSIFELHSQGSNIWTSYAYNPVNELLSIIDDQNNIIEYDYDWLGRRIQYDHPDGGLTTFSYDLVGNVTEKITANLQGDTGIQYVYDFERLTNINYPLTSYNNVTYTYGDAGNSEFGAGRIIKQKDATGLMLYSYDELGAVNKTERIILIPGSTPLSYTTEWEYDTWNRVKSMVYPDGEELTYQYNVGGMVNSLSGVKDGTTYNYLTQMGYDKFEQRLFMSYGNGTETSYSYEPQRRRLLNMTALTAEGREMMNNAYQYDDENNILQLTNSAPRPPSNLMGGSSHYSFVYDDLYRLTQVDGLFNGSNHDHRYSLTMKYNSIHAITQKTQIHERKALDETDWTIRNKTTYTFDYDYDPAGKPHAPIHIGEKTYTYDNNGNQLGWDHDINAQNRDILWDEENRIMNISDNGQSFSYFYDADHMRVFKSNGGGHTIDVNGAPVIDTGGIGNTIIYPNQYVVLRSGGATKHFFIESQRIASKLAESSDGLLQEGVVIPEELLAELNYFPEEKKGNNKGNEGNGNGKNQEAFQYFFHSDHLGSSSFITDIDGEVFQHLEYFAFGETFVEEHSNTHRTPYLFNGKELDDETGLYYYGMRYYDPVTSIWESVDPVADRLPSYSPYIYSLNNPITYSDPDGRFPIAPILWWAGKRAAAGAVADIAVQLASEWVMGGGSISDAWGRLDINEWQVIRSSGENLVSGKYSSAALSAAGDMITYMMNNEDWTWEGALLAAGEGGISALLGDKLGRAFMKKLNLRAGGAYGKFDNQYDDLGRLRTNKNHVPTVNSYRLAGFKVSDYMGSAHIMTVEDHVDFISTGSSQAAKAFRAAEAQLLKDGRFMDAFDLNVNAIRRQFGSKYDDALDQARIHFRENVVPILEKQIE